MKKITFGTPEKLVPSSFCKNFCYKEKAVSYPVDSIEFFTNTRGCCLRLPLDSDEQIYGLGLQLKCFNLRGKKLTLRPNADPVSPTGDSHAPVPFFVSTKGYGIYLDTARNAEFYFGSSALLKHNTTIDRENKINISTDDLYASVKSRDSNISIQIPAASGIDIYIIEGNNITEIVSKYNMLSGGGCTAPEWALSAIYRCFARYSQDKVVSLARSLKNNGFAIGTIGLEPGWMTRSYSDTYVWNSELYPEPQKMVDELKEMGLHINLWEHAFVHPESPIYEQLIPYSADYSVWNGCVPDFATDEARKIFADYHKTIVDMGIDGFKFDECDSGDITGSWSFPNMAQFPSGLDGEQYHSLFGILYMQTILDSLGDRPILSEVRNAGALSSSYPFVLYSDLYDHKDFIRGCCSAGFSGILWTPEVRDAKSKEEFIRRLQSNIFSVQCLINAWYCEDVPWKEFGCEKEVKELLNLRESLIPMLKKAFDTYKENGRPPVRALVSDFSTDDQTYNIDDEYIFCDSLIVAPIAVGENSRKVYLPEGKWQNYFTKEKVSSGWFEVTTDFIPVYERID